MARTSEQLTPAEILTVQELEALGNSGPTESVRKVGGHFVNGTPVIILNLQIPVGTIDGVNTVFTITGTMNGLFLNGIIQTPGGLDYTLVGTTITYVNPPPAGSNHYAI